jgi:hypothetical protein
MSHNVYMIDDKAVLQDMMDDMNLKIEFLNIENT